MIHDLGHCQPFIWIITEHLAHQIHEVRVKHEIRVPFPDRSLVEGPVVVHTTRAHVLVCRVVLCGLLSYRRYSCMQTEKDHSKGKEVVLNWTIEAISFPELFRA